MSKQSELKKGDYVLATKYKDGDPRDHFAVGIFDGMLIDNFGKETERYIVLDDNDTPFRASGFRRCEKISGKIGEAIVSCIPTVELASASVWYWRYHPKQLWDIHTID